MRLGIASATDSDVVVAAQTLPAPGASTRILEKLGFRRAGSVEHPQHDTVWEWRLS